MLHGPTARVALRVSLAVAADAALVAPLARELDAHVYAADGTRYA
jgi:hypothetical protein